MGCDASREYRAKDGEAETNDTDRHRSKSVPAPKERKRQGSKRTEGASDDSTVTGKPPVKRKGSRSKLLDPNDPANDMVSDTNIPDKARSLKRQGAAGSKVTNTKAGTMSESDVKNVLSLLDHDDWKRLFDWFTRKKPGMINAMFDSRITTGWTILMHACAAGKTATVAALVKAGANVELENAVPEQNAFVMTPLLVAIDKQRAETVKALLKMGASATHATIDFSPLQLAAIRAQPLVLQYVLEGGASPSQDDGWINAILNGCSAECLKVLAKHGADMNRVSTFGDTPLHACIEESGPREIEMASMLLELGADPATPDAFGFLPIHRICLEQRSNVSGQQMLALLLEAMKFRDRSIDSPVLSPKANAKLLPSSFGAANGKMRISHAAADRDYSWMQTAFQGFTALAVWVTCWALEVKHSSFMEPNSELGVLLLKRGANPTLPNAKVFFPDTMPPELFSATLSVDEKKRRVEKFLTTATKEPLLPFFLRHAKFNHPSDFAFVEAALERGAVLTGATLKHFPTGRQFDNLVRLLLMRGADAKQLIPAAVLSKRPDLKNIVDIAA